MPKVKRSRKPPPEGWELIEPTIDELDAKMREGIVIVSMFCICSVKSADFYSDFSQVYGSIVLLPSFALSFNFHRLACFYFSWSLSGLKQYVSRPITLNNLEVT